MRSCDQRRHKFSPLNSKLFAGFGGGEAVRERSEDGRAAAVRAEQTAQRHCDNCQREGPP